MSALYSLGPLINQIVKRKGITLDDGEVFCPPPFERSGSLDLDN